MQRSRHTFNAAVQLSCPAPWRAVQVALRRITARNRERLQRLRGEGAATAQQEPQEQGEQLQQQVQAGG